MAENDKLTLRVRLEGAPIWSDWPAAGFDGRRYRSEAPRFTAKAADVLRQSRDPALVDYLAEPTLTNYERLNFGASDMGIKNERPVTGGQIEFYDDGKTVIRLDTVTPPRKEPPRVDSAPTACFRWAKSGPNGEPVLQQKWFFTGALDGWEWREVETVVIEPGPEPEGTISCGRCGGRLDGIATPPECGRGRGCPR